MEILVIALAVLLIGTIARNKQLKRANLEQHRRLVEMNTTIIALRNIVRRRKDV